MKSFEDDGKRAQMGCDRAMGGGVAGQIQRERTVDRLDLCNKKVF